MNQDQVTINQEQRLYVIPCGKGYTCLGFDVCTERSKQRAEWLGESVRVTEIGTLAAYAEYERLTNLVRERNTKTGERCPVELTPQLIGLEGKRVEVVDCYGETRRFYVGKSTGWIPVHLEVARRDSTGGPAVMGAPFKSVRVVGTQTR